MPFPRIGRALPRVIPGLTPLKREWRAVERQWRESTWKRKKTRMRMHPGL